MAKPLTGQQLTEERDRVERLADLCALHGHVDGQSSMRAVAAAIIAEQVHRSRGGSPQ